MQWRLLIVIFSVDICSGFDKHANYIFPILVFYCAMQWRFVVAILCIEICSSFDEHANNTFSILIFCCEVQRGSFIIGIIIIVI